MHHKVLVCYIFITRMIFYAIWKIFLTAANPSAESFSLGPYCAAVRQIYIYTLQPLSRTNGHHLAGDISHPEGSVCPLCYFGSWWYILFDTCVWTICRSGTMTHNPFICGFAPWRCHQSAYHTNWAGKRRGVESKHSDRSISLDSALR